MIFYEGPSMIDGKPIVAIATYNSSNAKTGDMVQTWIIRSDIEPHKAIKTGDDSSVCGDCMHRPANNGSCYVLTFQAPLAVYRAYHRGSYADRDIESFRGKALRLGSYGDPLAVPMEAWEPLLKVTQGRTGYTHQWDTELPKVDYDAWKQLVMASSDTLEESTKAQSLGWRTFRVASATETKVKGEAQCPASEEMGHKLSCADCLSCAGNSGRNGKGIVIKVHGARKKNFKNNLIAVSA